jgi:hypothetical protein
MLQMLSVVVALALQPTPHVEALDWLEGHWRAEDTRVHNEVRFTEEIWTDGIAGAMFGIGRTVRGRQTQAFEYTRIAEEDGTLVFIAQPNGAPPVRFPMISQGTRKIVFANPANDHPQRMVYRRAGAVLHATISLSDGSNPTSWTYRLEPAR